MTPDQIHTIADNFKSRIKQDLPEADQELATLMVDCFAGLLVKISLCEEHMRRTADALETSNKLHERALDNQGL